MGPLCLNCGNEDESLIVRVACMTLVRATRPDGKASEVWWTTGEQFCCLECRADFGSADLNAQMKRWREETALMCADCREDVAAEITKVIQRKHRRFGNQPKQDTP